MKPVLLLSVAFIFLLAGICSAIPFRDAEHHTVPMRECTPAQDVCYVGYFNFCSGWVYYWSGYCYGLFPDYRPAKFGTCFDLTDCPGTCRHLTDVWYACKRYTTRGIFDVEVYCADESCCPIGPPLVGFYNYNPHFETAWQHFVVGEMPLCACEEGAPGNFIVLITDRFAGWHHAPYSDINHLNIDVGCETEWRCAGHSYVYKNVVNYCDVYGMPGPMWVSGADYGCTNYPTIPPGCHNYFYGSGYFTEFLIDCYISCLGATATEERSWSEVKGLYR